MRHYIGITPSGPTVLRNVHKDATGEPLLFVDQDATTKLRINFSAWLESGQSISSATVTAENCTVSTSTSSPNIDVTLSSVTSYNDGKITILATCSNGEIYRGIIRVRRTNRYTDEQRFRDYL